MFKRLVPLVMKPPVVNLNILKQARQQVVLVEEWLPDTLLMLDVIYCLDWKAQVLVCFGVLSSLGLVLDIMVRSMEENSENLKVKYYMKQTVFDNANN